MKRIFEVHRGSKVERLKTHDITLRSGDVALRPMTEDDWGILEKWNSDPDVMYYAGDPGGYSPEVVRRIYRGVCKNAFCFIIEFKGRPVGDCYLQKMNLERILKKLPDKDLRRIDIVIGEKELWGQGIGTKAVDMLIQYGFGEENADAIFACDVSDYNVRSFKMFQALGFEVFSEIKSETREGKTDYDMILRREKYSGNR